jgi:hypothetical protein
MLIQNPTKSQKVKRGEIAIMSAIPQGILMNEKRKTSMARRLFFLGLLLDDRKLL